MNENVKIFFGLIGGLALFLYGMSMLGSGLEKLSGGRMERTLEKLTKNVFMSVLPRCIGHCSDPKFLCHNGYCGGIGQRRNTEIKTRRRRYYGS